ncbi:MAG: HNH endonuclease [Solirubrobacterales bacterium]|nr:HNH endonuclease [Solirubrobacterales bacterium]
MVHKVLSAGSVESSLARSRKSVWLNDELILCLDLYRREGYSASADSMRELSQLLRSIPIESELTENPSFRSQSSVGRKLGNFAEFDPNVATGLPNGGARDKLVWDEFWESPGALEETAETIRSNIGEMKKSLLEEAGYETIDFAEAPEGRVLTRTHRYRERNSEIVEAKKSKVFDETGSLLCEACQFDFDRAYGSRGKGFIECHHTLPVSQLDPGHKTKLDDLALVCSNCHRMIHRKAPWLSIDELKKLVRKFRSN